MFSPLSKKELNHLIQTVVERYDPEKVYVFGSYARGEATGDSDVDLMIVKESVEPFYERRSEVRLLLRDADVPLDIFVYTPAEIKKLKKNKYSFLHEILTSGKLYYEKNLSNAHPSMA